MGGRSGNRGQCAQPCRLPDADGVCRCSLKDNCLAPHIEEIIASGVTSLKVEGRMKSPAYVYGVGKIYRTLLDAGRSATEEELDKLAALFSRSGFTDGYFTGNIGSDMLGVRTEEDKQKTKAAEAEAEAELYHGKRRLPVTVSAEIRANSVSSLTLTAGADSVTVYGDVPETAVTAPLTEPDVVKNLCRFGNTPFSVDISSFSLYLDKGVSLPISSINSLRRTAAERLEARINTVFYPDRRKTGYMEPAKPHRGGADGCGTAAHFVRAKGMPPRKALGGFSHIFLPIDEYLDAPTHVRDAVDGVELPPVVMQNEFSLLEEMLIRAKLCGIKHVAVQNIGQLRAAQRYGFQIHGGIFMNVYNGKTAEVLAKEGFTSLILSPELNAVQMKAVAAASPVRTGAAVYGKLPMTVLEKCIIREIAGVRKPAGKCEACGDGEFRYYRDRTGEQIPVHREFIHRNVTYNPYPIYMADKLDPVADGAVGDLHYFFTDETPEEAEAVIEAYQTKAPTDKKIRRM
jgi:putative protease